MRSAFRNWDTIKRTVRSTFSTASLVIGVIGGGGALIANVSRSDDTQQTILAITLGLIALVALLVVLFQEYRLKNATRYTSALRQAGNISERFLEAYSIGAEEENKIKNEEKIDKRSLAAIKKNIQDILNSTSEIYGNIVGNTCRASIKLIEERQGEFYVYTFSRDSLSAKANRKHDETRYKNGTDPLLSNSDFLGLFDDEKDDPGYFICNDLPARAGAGRYESTSLRYFRELRGNEKDNNKWPLWYRSTVVWPIRRDEKEEQGIESTRCVGFLAVDTDVKHGFTEKWDIPVGKMLAASLYTVLDSYLMLEQEKEGAVNHG